MIEFNEKTVWITGASSGIGKALALKISSLKANIVLSSRNKEELEKVAKQCKGETYILPLDLEKPEAFEKATQSVVKKYGSIARDWSAGWTPILDRYSTDLTAIITNIGFSEIVGHLEERSQAED